MDSLHNIKYFLKHQELERQVTDEPCYLEIKESKSSCSTSKWSGAMQV